MWVLRNYDKMARENHLLRHYLNQIPADIVERYNVTARENGRINKVVEEQEKQIVKIENDCASLKGCNRKLTKELNSVKKEKSILSRKIAAYVMQTGTFIALKEELEQMSIFVNGEKRVQYNNKPTVYVGDNESD